MKRYLVLIIASLAAFLTACDKADVKIFRDKPEIYFEKFYLDATYPGVETKDSTEVSFFSYPEGTAFIQVPLVVNLSGRLLTRDLSFGLKVVPEATTANADEYELEDKYIFRAGTVAENSKQIQDTIYVKINYSSRLDQEPEGIALVLELVPNEEVGLGQLERRAAKIIVSSQAIPPEWWNEEVTNELLGPYSQTKYKLFLKEIDTTAKLNGTLIKEKPDEAIKLVMQFKEWLGKQNPPLEDENGLITVKL